MAVGPLGGNTALRLQRERVDVNDTELADRFAHLRKRASERSDRTVERVRAGIGALQASKRKITAESFKQVTRELETGFAGLSFQVIRRNTRAYALYREAADAFSEQVVVDNKTRAQRRRR